MPEYYQNAYLQSRDNYLIQNTRTVIANKLLAALDNDDKVAILATEADLNTLIEALSEMALRTSGRPRFHNLARDLAQLKQEAFD